jgi:integrase
MANNHPGLKRIGDFWHFSLKVNGQRLHGSTRAKDLPTAKLVLEERRKELLLCLNGVTRVPTLTELVSQWLKEHRGVHSEKHWHQVERFTRIWLFPAFGRRRVNQIRTEDVARLRTRMLEAGKSPVTVNDALKILKLLCRYAMKLGSLRELPFRVEFLRVQRKPRPIVPAPRLQSFLAEVEKAARNPHVAVLLKVMVGMGLRESEALGMRWEWFDTAQRCYIVGKSKNHDSRVLPIPGWLWTAIYEMPKTISEWVFPAKDGKPHRTQFTRKALQRVCEKLGLGNVTQHRLRATFASLLAGEAGTPITEIQGFLGHQSVETTMIYVETSLEAKRRAQDTLSQKLGLA